MSRSTSCPALRGGDAGRDGRPLGAHLSASCRVRQSTRVWNWFQDVGLCVDYVSWSSQLVGPSAHDDRWMSMGYQMKREIKIKLIFLYYELLCKLPLPLRYLL
jgi:hypothetical protein